MDGSQERDSLIEEVVRGVGSALVGLHLKGALQGELSTISRNWLILGQGVPSFQVSTAPDIKASEHRK